MPLLESSHLRTIRPQLIVSAIVSGVGAIAEALALVLVAPLAQTVASGEKSFEREIGPLDLNVSVIAMGLTAAAAVLVSMAFNAVAEIVRGQAVAGWQRDVRHRLALGFLNSSWTTQSAEKTGAVQEVIGAYVSRGGQGLAALLRASRALMSVLVLILGALLIDVRAAGGIVLCGALLFVLLRPMVSSSRRHAQSAADSQLTVAALVAEFVDSAREIRVFGAVQAVVDRVDRRLDRFRSAESRAVAIGGMVSSMYQGVGLLVLVGILLVAAAQSQVEIATLGAVALLLLRSFSFGQQLIASYQRVQEAQVYFSEIDSMLNRLDSGRPRAGWRTLSDLKRVQLHGVTFRYSPEDPAALLDVDLTLDSGEIVGLAGPSGAGKSTLAELVLRLRRPTSGRITIDGIDIEEFDDESWCQAIALVPQAVHLIQGSVADNVRYFRELDDVAVEQGLAAAGMRETIIALPKGLQTSIGPATRALSGGQTQRLGIARALVGNPRLLVLDEPTSALDAASEETIHDALRSLRGSSLVLVIAHRASTLALCDRVVWLADGRVHEEVPGRVVANTTAQNPDGDR